MNNTANILQIAANLGILAGLVLVGLQIREANRLADTQFEYEAWGGAMNAHEILLGDDFAETWAKAWCNSQDLDARDLVLIDSFLTREWLHNTRVARVRSAGYDRAEQNRTATKWVFSFLGNESGLRWWKHRYDGGGSFLGSYPEMRDEIQKLLEQLGEDHSQLHRTSLELQKPGVCA